MIFQWLFLEIPQHMMTALHFTGESIAGLQEAAEAYLVRLFKDTTLCVIYARIVSIILKDVQLDGEERIGMGVWHGTCHLCICSSVHSCCTPKDHTRYSINSHIFILSNITLVTVITVTEEKIHQGDNCRMASVLIYYQHGTYRLCICTHCWEYFFSDPHFQCC